MSAVADNVRAFHETFGAYIGDTTRPDLGDTDLGNTRAKILAEEFDEYITAESLEDIVGVADALADIVYVAYGTALAYGIDLDRVLAEVHASNMTKLGEDGKPIYREDGKVLKGPNYRKPNIAGVLGVVQAVPTANASSVSEDV